MLLELGLLLFDSLELDFILPRDIRFGSILLIFSILAHLVSQPCDFLFKFSIKLSAEVTQLLIHLLSNLFFLILER